MNNVKMISSSRLYPSKGVNIQPGVAVEELEDLIAFCLESLIQGTRTIKQRPRS